MGRPFNLPRQHQLAARIITEDVLQNQENMQHTYTGANVKDANESSVSDTKMEKSTLSIGRDPILEVTFNCPTDDFS